MNWITTFQEGRMKMPDQKITVTLPDSIYERIKKTAQATSLSSEDVIKQSVSLLLPAFESDIPANVRMNLSKLVLLNDMQLWKTANYSMPESDQTKLEKLAEIQKHRVLTEEENLELEHLMNEAQKTMLLKAEARRLLAQRGLRFRQPPPKKRLNKRTVSSPNHLPRR